MSGATVVGFGCVLGLIGLAGRAARVADQGPPSRWLGLLGGRAVGQFTAGQAAAEVLAVAGLLLCWGVLLTTARVLRVRSVVGIAALWSLPLALGPPGFSLDSYSYLAQGRLAAIGLDPYRSGPAALGDGAWLHAVDPFWRHSVSPYGPVALLVERAAASTGSPLLAMAVLHALAWVSIMVIAAAVTAAAAAPDRSRALALTALNPLVLMQLLGAAHWEALMMALVAGALWNWRQGRPLIAVALSAAATAVKAPAGYAVVVLLVLHLTATPRPQRLRVGLTAAAAAAGPWLAVAAWVHNPLGFLAGLTGPLTGRTLYAPTTLLAEALAGAGHLLLLPVPFMGLLSACRVGGLCAAGTVCAWLLVTARRRQAAQTIGLGLLAVAALGPVLYPWYLTWGLIPLTMAGPRQRRLVIVTALSSFTALPGCIALGRFLLSSLPVMMAGAGGVLLATALSGAALKAAQLASTAAPDESSRPNPGLGRAAEESSSREAIVGACRDLDLD